jgi:prevent-host-death family protein
MTRTRKRPPVPQKRRRIYRKSRGENGWKLYEAKARFSEVVHRANTVGPQRVTVHGTDEVVIISAEEYARLKGERSGRVLFDMLRKSPLNELDLERKSVRSPVRDVQL